MVRRDGLMFLSGLLAAAVLLPATVMAAASVFTLQGGSGNSANVDAAHQLMVAESDPAAFLPFLYHQVDNGLTCVVLDRRSATKALVIDQLRIEVVSSDALDFAHRVDVYPNTSCSGGPLFVYQPSHRGSYTESFAPGYPIRASTGVSAVAHGSGLETYIGVSGYTVAAAAVP